MTKRKVTQLLAVVALATSAPMVSAEPAKAGLPTAQKPRTLPSGAPACGNVQGKGQRPRRCETTTTTTTTAKPEPAKPTPTTAANQSPAMIQKLLAIFGGGAAVRPRELPTGAPANGNVARRTSGSRQEKPVETPANPRTSN